MASTYTTWAGLEKPEDRSVAWDLSDSLDVIDQGISVHLMTADSSGAITGFNPVSLSDNFDFTVFQSFLSDSYGPAFGIALADIAASGTGYVLRRGFVENPAWTWSSGDHLYLLNDGTIGTRALLTHIGQSLTDDSRLLMQPVGYAVSATKAWFDFNARNGWPYEVPASGYVVTAGSATASLKSIASHGSMHVLSSSSATVVYTFLLPPWFRAMPDILSIWGFRIRYLAAGGGSIDVTNVYDAQAHSGDPGVAAGTSATWAAFDVNWDKFNDVAGWAPLAGHPVHVAVAVAGATVDFEVAPRLRFEPRPTIWS